MTRVGSEARLLPHQLDFYTAFRKADSPQRQMLLGPPGLGKGFVAQALAHDLAQSDPCAPILVLAPRALVSAFASGLAEFEPKYSVDMVDRRRLRELLSDQPAANWPPRAVVVMSIDLAKQDDVLELLASVQWGFVIIDEAHSLEGRRRQLVRRLAEAASRMLLLSSTDDPPSVAQALADLAVVRWERSVVDETGKPLFVSVPRAHHVIEYERTDAEAAFAREALGLLDRLGPSDRPQSALIRRVMLNALASSPNAIEQFLLRQLDRLGPSFPLARDSEEAGSADPLEGETEGFVIDYSSIWDDPDAASSALSSLVAQLDALPTDAKARQFQQFFAERVDEASSRICIFSIFAGTAEYLAAVLEEVAEVELLTGRMSYDERAATLSRFRDGGVALITTGAAYGVNLAISDIAIHYDLPEGRRQMEERWGRVDRVGQTRTVHGYAFRDVRRTLDWEERLLQRHGFLE